MKIRYNRKTFPYIFILTFIFIVEMHYFGLFVFSSSIEFIIYTNRSKWIAPLAVIIAMVCWKNHYNGTLKLYQSFLKKYLIIATVSVFVLYIHAYFVYPLNSLLTTYGLGTYYFYAYLAIPMIHIFEQDEGMEDFLKVINIIVLIMYAISVIQGIHYLKTGELLFSAAERETVLGLKTRNGKLRIGGGAFGNIMLIYNIYNLYNVNRKNRKNGKISVLIVILGTLNVCFTGQTRVALLSIFIAVGALVLMGDGSNSKKLWALFAVFACIFVILLSDLPAKILNSFSQTGLYGGSTIARVNAWKYYLNQFRRNPIFFNGFAGDANYYNIVHGNSGIYYQGLFVFYDYSDCGYVGELAKTGLFSIFLYLWPFCRFIRTAICFIKVKAARNGALIVSLVCYLAATSTTLIVLNSDRVIVWPLFIAIFEFTHCRINDYQKTI